MELATRGFNLDSSPKELTDRFLNDFKCAPREEECNFTNLSHALLHTKALSSILKQEIGELLDMLPEFYQAENTINREGENQEELIELASKEIALIRKDNQNQGKNGVFSFVSRDSFKILSMSLEQISADNDNLRREVLCATFETLNAENQECLHRC